MNMCTHKNTERRDHELLTGEIYQCIYCSDCGAWLYRKTFDPITQNPPKLR